MYRVTQEIKLFSSSFCRAHCALLYVETLLMGNAQWANSVPKRKLAKFLKIEEIYGVVKKLGKLEIPVAQQNLKTEFFKICYF